MWNGYLRLGGNEIVNTPRVVALASSLGLPLGIECDECPGLADMAGAVYGDAEAFGDVTTAPWYDANDPASEDFIGFVGLKIRDALDSTREAPVFQRLGDGGVLGRERHRTREVRVTGLLIGRDRLSIDYGMSWVSSALGRNSCGQHGMTCGLADLEWLADCPAAQGAETDPDYAAAVAPLRRFVHDVGTTSGPLLLEERETDCFQIYEIEFTITAQEPRVFGAPKAFELTPALITGKSDVVRNLIPVPSAELLDTSTPAEVVAKNHVVNPSFEESLSGWGYFVGSSEETVPSNQVTFSRYYRGSAAPAGDYVAQLQWPDYETTDPNMRAGFNVVNLRLPDMPVGTSLRFGGRVYWTRNYYMYDDTFGLSLEFYDEESNIILTASHGEREYGTLTNWADLRLPESVEVPEDAWAYNMSFWAKLNPVNGSIRQGTLSLDAVWLMEG